MEWSWPIPEYYCDVDLEGLRKIMKTSVRIARVWIRV
jgi:hypothetical protein